MAQLAATITTSNIQHTENTTEEPLFKSDEALLYSSSQCQGFVIVELHTNCMKLHNHKTLIF